jgi:hypothetical protein
LRYKKIGEARREEKGRGERRRGSQLNMELKKEQKVISII